MSRNRNNVTGRSTSLACPICGAPRPMDGHAYTLEEINSLTADQACWVEANSNFDDLPAVHEDNVSEGELPFHEASQNNSLKPVHHMEVDSNETVRGGDSNRGYQYAASEVNAGNAAAVREYFAPGNHLSNPLRAPSSSLWPLGNHPAPHQSRLPEHPPPNSTPTPAHLGFARPNVADYGPLPAQAQVTDVNKAMKEWNREIVGIRCLVGKARQDFDSSVRTGADPRTWDNFADWLIKHNPDTSNTEVVANAYQRLRQMPNERAVNFYNRFREWQLDAETYEYSHHEQTGFVERLEPHLRQRVQTAISTAVNLGHPMNFEQITMCAIDDDRRHQHYRGMNSSSRAPLRAPPQASTSAYQSGSPSGVQRRHSSGTQGGKKKADYSIRTCYNCGGQGHISAKCTEPKSKRQLKYESDIALSSINSSNVESMRHRLVHRPP
ncbi:hypothetical protein PSHT_12050 [Puccinia striiformis]|uniref:CCHC-type domain-containing protein n=1 Tax=Puccinia striiformis TaxID=27350 RepID=A0A2S4UZC2_9BASI|nr:hypothetical protein PSHT_12050 [Puccinia striiformis]